MCGFFGVFELVFGKLKMVVLNVLKGTPCRRKGLAKARGVTFTPRNRPRRRLKAWHEMRCDNAR